MLIDPTVDTLEEKIGNRHILSILAAKRARDLGDGLRPITEECEYPLVSQAATEIASGLITYRDPEHAEAE